MARPVRFQHPGAIDHVMVRGDGGETVFETDDDRKSFVFRLGQVCESHGWRMLSAKDWQKHSTNHEKTRACESARPDPIHRAMKEGRHPTTANTYLWPLKSNKKARRNQ